MLLPLPSQRPAPPTEPGSSCHRAEHLHQTVPPLLQIQPSPLGLVRLAEGIYAIELAESPCLEAWQLQLEPC